MVFDSSYLQGRHLVRPRHAADVCPDARFDLWLDICHAVFCAEDDMVIESHVGVCHIFCSLGWFNRRYATGKYVARDRGLKPTAKFIRPLRGGRKRAM